MSTTKRPHTRRPIRELSPEAAARKAEVEAKFAASARACAVLARDNAALVGSPDARRFAGLTTTLVAVAVKNEAL